jgi:carbon storage regulator CsrA
MLVLSRKIQEQIRIGDDVTITILRVKGNTVRIGIEAPRTKRVIRAELPALEPGEKDASRSEPSLELRVEGGSDSVATQESLTDAPSANPFARQERLSTIKDRLRGHWPTPAAN